MSYNDNWLLENGFNQPSKSLFGASVFFLFCFFVKKADGSLRLVCDWRDLSRITVKNEACILNVDDLLTLYKEAGFSQNLT